MVSDQTVYSFVVGNRVSGPELYDYLLVTIFQNGSFDLVKKIYIIGIHKELKLSIQIWVVIDCEDFIERGIKFNLSKIYTIPTEVYIELMRVTFKIETYLIATLTNHLSIW